MCKDYSNEELQDMAEAENPVIPPIYEDCHVCSFCEECRNGVGLKSPPGLRGHSMIMGESGFFIYGGT